MFFGSDALAVGPFTNRISLPRRRRLRRHRPRRRPHLRRARRAGRCGRSTPWPPRPPLVEKGNYRHFMEKEIHDQPDAAQHTLAAYLDPVARRATPPAGLDLAKIAAHPDRRLRHRLLRRADRQVSDRAAGRPADRRRDRLGVPLPRAGADARRAGHRHLAVGRDRRHAGGAALLQGARARHRRHRQRARARPWRARPTSCWPTNAGPEIGVASTKAFTAQVCVLLALGRRRRRRRAARSTRTRRAGWSRVLLEAPRLIADAIAHGGPGARGRGARSPRPATCSTSAAGRCTRWRWKAR